MKKKNIILLSNLLYIYKIEVLDCIGLYAEKKNSTKHFVQVIGKTAGFEDLRIKPVCFTFFLKSVK